MATVLIVARHGNTFRDGETPRRVGARTDLPLTETRKGECIGRYLAEKGIVPAAVFAAPLQRTMQTARLAVEAMGLSAEVRPATDFTEIDYGPDENRTEEEVMARLGGGDSERGRAVLEAWNRDATVPEGWDVNPAAIIENWRQFADMVQAEYRGQAVLVVSSNGIIRFAPYLTGNFDGFAAGHDIKVAPGGLCIFTKEDGARNWTCSEWNTRPFKIYPQE